MERVKQMAQPAEFELQSQLDSCCDVAVKRQPFRDVPARADVDHQQKIMSLTYFPLSSPDPIQPCTKAICQHGLAVCTQTASTDTRGWTLIAPAQTW